jgi:hypothetical protein
MMDHAEAHERLSDLALEPAAIESLAAADDPVSRALRTHLATCPRCAADLSGWRRTWAAVGAARLPVHETGDLDSRTPQLLAPPGDLRARVMEAIERAPAAGQPPDRSAPERATERSLGSMADLPRHRFAALRHRAIGLVAAAAVAVALLAGGTAIQSRLDLQHARSANAALESVQASMSRILAQPGHTEVPLRAADGSTGGVLAWSDAEFAVLTSDLAAPGEGQTYRCWIELGGTRTVMGDLAFSGSTASWSGSMNGWQWYFAPGATFGISLYSGAGSSPAPVLATTL